MTWKSLLVLTVALVTAAFAILPIFSRPSNCGGNSAALNQVKTIALVAWIAAHESTNSTFRFTDHDSEQRTQLSKLSRDHWIPDAHFLVSTLPIIEPEAQPNRIVVACDKPYSNVPQRWIGSSPLAHAVGFANGSSGLISQMEFSALDLSTFTRLDQLYPVIPK